MFFIRQSVASFVREGIFMTNHLMIILGLFLFSHSAFAQKQTTIHFTEFEIRRHQNNAQMIARLAQEQELP